MDRFNEKTIETIRNDGVDPETLAQIDDRIQVPVVDEDGFLHSSVFRGVDRSEGRIIDDIEVWHDVGMVLDFEIDDDGITVYPDRNHPLAPYFDKYFENAYSSFRQDDGILVMTE